MLLEGGIFVKTCQTRLYLESTKKEGFLPEVVFGSLWLDVLGGQAPQTLRNQPSKNNINTSFTVNVNINEPF